jgi:hypothetical protein
MYTGHACIGFVNEYLNGKFCGRIPVRKTTAETDGKTSSEGNGCGH